VCSLHLIVGKEKVKELHKNMIIYTVYHLQKFNAAQSLSNGKCYQLGIVKASHEQRKPLQFDSFINAES